MNPFDFAQTLGFGKNDILKFLAKANPQMSNAISQAVQMGYSSDDVFQYMSKAMSGAKVDPKFQKRVFGRPNEASMMRQSVNAPQKQGKATQLPLLGGLAGAGAGFLAGGPAGAVAGGILGYKQLDKLAKAYENHTQNGGRVPFGEFVAEMAKGTAMAGVAASQVEPLREAAQKYLEAASGKEGEEQENQQDVEGDGDEPPPAAPTQEVEEEGEVVEETPTGQESYEYFKKRGLDRIIDSFSTQITPHEARRGLKNLFGAEYIKDIERENKRPIEEMIGEAFSWSQEKGSVPRQSEYVEKAMEGIDFKELPRPVKNRLRMINQQLERLEEKGTPYEGNKIQKILKKRDELLKGEGLNLLEEEETRFEKAYGDQTPQEKPMQPEQSEVFTEIFQKNITEGEEIGTIQKNVKPLANSLKSSNVVGAFYDADTDKMRTVFRSGDMYEYENISLDELEKITGGKAKPITEGATQYGFWFPDKKKSVGAAFSKFIKKKADEFPYRKLDKSELRPNEEQLRDAVRTFNVSGFFEPFKKERKKGQQLEKGKVLREMEPALKEMDDDFMQEVVSLIEDKLGLKTPIKVSRLQKEFKKEFLQ